MLLQRLNEMGNDPGGMRGFFHNGWEYIAKSNLHTLKRATVYAAAISGLLGLYALWSGQPENVVAACLAEFAIQLPWAVWLHFRGDTIRWRTRVIRYQNFAFLLATYALLVHLSTVGMSGDPGIFFAPFAIVLSMVFIKRLWQGVALVSVATAGFLLLSYHFKAYHAFSQDVGIAVITWVLSVASGAEILHLRLRDYRLRDELLRLSCTDGLTGLLNKSTAETAARQYLTQRGTQESCALFVIDLDQFKQINDLLGHQAGDEALEAFGETLTRLFRAQDIVGRIGGDEFVALMKNIGDDQLVQRRAETVCQTMRHTKLTNRNLSITCSVGVAMDDGTEACYDDLFRRADEQLYHVKRNGKNGYAITLVQ